MSRDTFGYTVKRCGLWLALILLTSCLLQGVSSISAAQQPSGGQGESRLIDITFEGGTGKAYIRSPVEVTQAEDGTLKARFVWSSRNYDYMIVGGVRYENENEGGDSTFTVPVPSLEEPLTVIGDTVAMSTPHEIEYVITWETENIQAGEDQENGGRQGEDRSDPAEELSEDGASAGETRAAFAAAGIPRTGSMELQYAEGFRVEYFDPYTLISIENSGEYVLVPSGSEVPSGIPESAVIIRQPVERTYLVSTSAMDLIRCCGALDRIRLSGTRENDWYIEDAKNAMQKGDIIYAGRYRAPDYETILAESCDLCIENTMIYHEPAVKAKLEELGIPVLVETSSREPHPLGRLEWIRLYGVLFDREKEADAYFTQQLQALQPLLEEKQDTGKSAAFFHITGNGMINVRRPGDYISRMIELAGGHYVPSDTGGNENALSTMNMQMEDFYAAAAEADILLYNSTIGGEIASVGELTQRSALFEDFRAVKEGNVYCVERNFFQQITGMAEFMQDLSGVLNGSGDGFTYLKKLE